MEAEKSWIAVNNCTPKLTAAEKKVLDLVSLARTNKEIAAIHALTIAGCPPQSNPGCPLKLWQKKRDATATMWAV
jgi:hypothetical protein